MASARVTVGSDLGSDSEIQDEYLGTSDSEGGDGEGGVQDVASSDSEGGDAEEGTQDGEGSDSEGGDGEEGTEDGEGSDSEGGDGEEGTEDGEGSDSEGGDAEEDTQDGEGSDSEGGDAEGGVQDLESIDSEGSDEDEDTQDGAGLVSGITDVMSKILNNFAPIDKAPILAQGQTDRQIKRKKKRKEKEDADAEGKPAHKKSKEDGGSSSDWSDESDKDAGRKSYLQMQKRREWNDVSRVKPNVLSKEKERRLQKIATRGVVQIFNVVRQQQSIVGEKLWEAGSSVRRRDKVMGAMSKKQFLDLLDHSQTKSSASAPVTQDGSEEPQSGAKWSILRDDFMMKASMKDWDRDDADDDDVDDR